MPANAVVRHIVTFGRVLREVGVEVGPGRVADALKGSTRSSSRGRTTSTGRCGRRSSRGARTSSRSTSRSTPGSSAPRSQPRASQPSRPPPHGERRKGGEPGPGPEIDGGVAEVGGWNADELLRTKDFGAMTPEELARAKKLIQAIAVARPRRRTRRLRPDAKGHALDVRGLVRASLSTGGDPVRARVPQPRRRAAQARADPRRVGLDGCVRPRAAAVPARGARRGAARRDVRVRHAPDAVDAGARLARPGDGVRGSRRARHRLVRRHTHRRVAQGLQRRVGPTRAHARRRRRDPLRRVRARRHGARRPRDGAARAAGVRGRLGQPAQGPPAVRAAGRRHARGAALRRPLPLGARRREPRGLGTVLGGIERRHAA